QDPNGNLIWLTYETYSRYGVTGSRLARVDTPGGRYLWFGYDYYQPDRLVQVGDHSGRSVYFDYNPDGYLSEVTDVLGATAVYTYENGFLATKVNALDITVFDNTYDTHGRVVAQTNHLGQQLSLDYVTSSSGITTTVTE